MNKNSIVANNAAFCLSYAAENPLQTGIGAIFDPCAALLEKGPNIRSILLEFWIHCLTRNDLAIIVPLSVLNKIMPTTTQNDELEKRIEALYQSVHNLSKESINLQWFDNIAEIIKRKTTSSEGLKEELAVIFGLGVRKQLSLWESTISKLVTICLEETDNISMTSKLLKVIAFSIKNGDYGME